MNVAELRAIRCPLNDRVLFGSDYPLITPERWMKGSGRLIRT